MKLDRFSDAQAAALTLKTSDEIADALIEAKVDGLTEAIGQISQANENGTDAKLKAIHDTLETRRAILSARE